MSKRKIIAILIIVLVLVTAVVSVCVVISKQKNESQQILQGSQNEIITDAQKQEANWLKMNSVSQLEEAVKKNELEVERDVNKMYVKKLPFGENSATYCYTSDKEGNITGLSIGYVLVNSTESNGTYTMETIDAEELYGRSRSTIMWLSDCLGVQVLEGCYTIFKDGTIGSANEVESYQKILNGEAHLESRILDTDGSVWTLVIEKIQGYNIISCILEHHAPDSEQAKIPCYISITE